MTKQWAAGVSHPGRPTTADGAGVPAGFPADEPPSHTSARSRACPHADQLPPRRYVCDDCARERRRERERKWRSQPEVWARNQRRARERYEAKHEEILEQRRAYYEANRARIQAYMRAYHVVNRERANAKNRAAYWDDHEAALERKAAERARVRADPKRLAAQREYHRMWRRLRAERDGRPRAPVPEAAYPPPSTQWTLPAEPLREIVVEWEREADRAGLAAAAGVSERLVHRLVHEGGASVSVAAADRLLAAMGLHLDMIYGDAA